MHLTILLNDLLHLDDDTLIKTKIRFNQWNGEKDPMDEYQKDPERINTGWLLWRTKQRYFKVGQNAICFLRIASDSWLMTTMKQITGELGITSGINYVGKELDEYKSYYGRVIIKYKKSHQTQCVNMKNILDKLEVQQILPSIYDGEDFPGYDKVRLSFSQLETIIVKNKRDWVAALENQKAVYLITDLNNGKLYVGSAYGDNGMLLQRWRRYTENGHGGNIELRDLIAKLGFDYVKKFFQYAILENYNSRADKDFILQREAWWKETLATRKFGYNSN